MPWHPCIRRQNRRIRSLKQRTTCSTLLLYRSTNRAQRQDPNTLHLSTPRRPARPLQRPNTIYLSFITIKPLQFPDRPTTTHPPFTIITSTIPSLLMNPTTPPLYSLTVLPLPPQLLQLMQLLRILITLRCLLVRPIAVLMYVHNPSNLFSIHSSPQHLSSTNTVQPCIRSGLRTRPKARRRCARRV